MRAPRVHIIVTCTNRKQRAVPEELQLRSLTQLGTAGRFDAWIKRLSSSDAPAVPVGQLYAGDQWQIARTLHTKVENARTWICSAGYGLVPLDAELRPYAATFATDQPDSVGNTTAKIQQWWQYLTTWRGPGTTAPRSLATLADTDPNATFVVVLSSSYLRAIGPDIVNAASHLRNPERMSIISANASSAGEWDRYLLPTDARLQNTLGGSLGSLNVRIAAKLLEGNDLSRPALTEHLLRLRSASAPRRKFERVPMSDDEVLNFITERLTPRSTHTSMLRELRDAGFACEQGRFRQLFRNTVGSG